MADPRLPICIGIYIFFSRYKLNDEKLYKPMAPSNTRQNNSIDIQKRKKNEGGKSFFLYVTFYRLSKRRKIPADSGVKKNHNKQNTLCKHFTCIIYIYVCKKAPKTRLPYGMYCNNKSNI